MKDFISQLASKAPTPGGGSAGCVIGAIGLAAAQMVLNLTIGKKKYHQYEEANQETKQALLRFAEEFLTLKEKDEQVFQVVAKAYALPKGDERRREIQKALQAALQPPYLGLELALRTLELVQSLLDTTNANLISDLAVAVFGLEAAAKSCYFNVLVNIKHIKDQQFCDIWTSKAKDCYDNALRISDKTQEEILQKLT